MLYRNFVKTDILWGFHIRTWQNLHYMGKSFENINEDIFIDAWVYSGAIA